MVNDLEMIKKLLDDFEQIPDEIIKECIKEVLEKKNKK